MAVFSQVIPATANVPPGGTTGQVLAKASDANFDTEWVAAGGGGGATTELDNLTTTAINADLLPATDSTTDLGSTLKKWADVHADNVNTASLNSLAVPAVDGTAGQALQTDGAGTISFQTPAVYADQDLGNLTSPTAVNQDILPAVDSTTDLGSALKKWADVHADNVNTVSLNSLAVPAVDGTAGQVLQTDGAGTISFQTPTVYADRNLGNLTSPTSVNQDLIPDATNTRKIGSLTKLYDTLYVNDVVTNIGALGLKSDTAGVSVRGNATGSGVGKINIYDLDASNSVSIKSPDVVASNVTFALPGVDGTSGQVLKTDGLGTLSFVDQTAAGANTALSNLSSVAINTSLLPGVDNTIDVGSSAKTIKDTWTNNIKTPSTTDLVIQAGGGAATKDVSIKGDGTTASSIKFHDDDNASFTALKSASTSIGTTHTLPAEQGSANQFLKTDGSGIWSFDYPLVTGVDEKTTNYTITLADRGRVISFTGSGASTFSLNTLPDKWYAYIRHDGGNVDLTIDPASTEQVDGQTTIVMHPGDTRLITGTSAAFNTVLLQGGSRTFSTAGANTFNVPTKISQVEVELWGGGGSGASGRRGASATTRSGGGGGGGGGYNRIIIPAASLGTSVTVTIATAVTGGAAQTADNTNGNNGTNGNNTTFGTFLTAYGGGSGAQGSSATTAGGGGGGAMTAGAANTAGNGGSAADGRAGSAGNSGLPGYLGGASGGGSGVSAANAGGASFFAGAGGGSGGGISSGNATFAGADGGGFGQGITTGGGGTGGGAAGAQSGNNGTSTGNACPGTAGGGGGGGAATTGGNGGNGGPGCGGGGGGGSLNGNNSGAGGNGGDGYCRIRYW